MSNSDLIAEARGFLAGAGKATLLGRLTDALESAESENVRLRAELAGLQSMQRGGG